MRDPELTALLEEAKDALNSLSDYYDTGISPREEDRAAAERTTRALRAVEALGRHAYAHGH